MSWANLPQEIVINIWQKCDVDTQKKMSRVSKTWFSFVRNELRSPVGPFAKWVTDYLPDGAFSPQLIADDYTLVRVYFHLCDINTNVCYLMDKMIRTGHGMERLFKLVGMTRFEYAVAVLLRLQNRFSPSKGELYGSDMEGRIVYYEDDYYAHLKSRMSSIGRTYIATVLLEGLRYKRLYEHLLKTKECVNPVNVDAIVLIISLMDPDYFQLMMCRKRVLDRVAVKYADTVIDSMPIETRILNISTYLQRFTSQESDMVNGVVEVNPKRLLLSRYYGGDIAIPSLFIFTCALCEALKACNFKCYLLELDKILIWHRDKVYSCTVGEEFVIRELLQDDEISPHSTPVVQAEDCFMDGEKGGPLPNQKHFGMKTGLEALKIILDAFSFIRTDYTAEELDDLPLSDDEMPRDELTDDDIRNEWYFTRTYDEPQETETALLGKRKIVFLHTRRDGAYNFCARSHVDDYYFIGPVAFIKQLLGLMPLEESIQCLKFTPTSAKALMIRGSTPGLHFVKNRFRIDLSRSYSKLFFKGINQIFERKHFSGHKDGTVFANGKLLAHASGLGYTKFLGIAGKSSERWDPSPPLADYKTILMSAQEEGLGEIFSHFDWNERRWIHNKLFEISCEEFDKYINDELDMSVTESEYEYDSELDNTDEDSSPPPEHPQTPIPPLPVLRTYGASSRLEVA